MLDEILSQNGTGSYALLLFPKLVVVHCKCQDETTNGTSPTTVTEIVTKHEN